MARLNHRMDAALKGHPYVKSAIDIACWDILGQAAGLPVCELLGGRFGPSVELYRAISQEAPRRMAARALDDAERAAIPWETTRAAAILVTPAAMLPAAEKESVRRCGAEALDVCLRGAPGGAQGPVKDRPEIVRLKRILGRS